jgi:hypothetical protein
MAMNQDSLVLNLLMLVQFLSHLGYTTPSYGYLIWFAYTPASSAATN